MATTPDIIQDALDDTDTRPNIETANNQTNRLVLEGTPGTAIGWLGQGEEKVTPPLPNREENGQSGGSEEVTLPPVLCRSTRHSANHAVANTEIDESRTNPHNMNHTRSNETTYNKRSLILSWNIQALRTGKPELDLLIREFQPTVICLQETMCSSRNRPSIKGYNVVNRPRMNCHRAAGGVLIAVMNGIDYEEIDTGTTLEAVIVKIGAPLNISIANVYFPPREDITPSDIELLINCTTEPILFVGDINAHHPLWGSVHSDRRGDMMEEVFAQHDLVMLNSGETTYISHATGNESCIDVACCSSALAGLLEWNIVEDTHGSDHHPATIFFPCTLQEMPTKSRWNVENSDWEMFQNNLTLPTKIDPEEQLKELTTEIMKAATVSIPRTSGNLFHKSVPWWNKEVETAVKRRRKALRKMKSVTADDPGKERLVEEFKNARIAARKIIDTSKQSSWQTFVKSFNVHTSIRDMWRQFRRIQGGNKISCIRAITYRGHTATGNQEIAESLSDAFCAVSSSSSYSNTFRQFKDQMEAQPLASQRADGESYNNMYSLFELDEALEGVKNSSPGEDDIHYAMITHLPREFKVQLLETFNKLWVNSTYPSEWTKSIVVPIFKGRGEASNPKNYRPIFLNSCVAKVFEKMVNNRLVYILESRQLFHQHQYGFRKGHSTTDHLIQFEKTIRGALAKKLYAQAVFLDISKAYDTTWRRLILESLCSWNIGGYMFKFILQSLQRRTFKVATNGALSSEKVMENGLCQGSVLSCTLFLIAINTLIKYLPGDVISLIYADDVVLISEGRAPEEAEGKLQRALDAVSVWESKTGFRVSPDKCATITFKSARTRRIPQHSTLKLNNVPIPRRKVYKCLGVTFDQELQFKRHIEEVRTSCQQRVQLIKCVSSRSWGGDRTTIARLYKSTVLEKMLYAAPLLSAVSDTNLKRLETVHNTGLRAISGAFYTSPVISLQAETGIPGLRALLDQRTAIHSAKIQSNRSAVENNGESLNTVLIEDSSEHTTTDSDGSSGELWGAPNRNVPAALERGKLILNDLEIQLPVTNVFTTPKTAPWERRQFSVDKTLLTATRQNASSITLLQLFLRRKSTRYRVHRTIYTDGSRRDSKSGYSVVSEQFTIRRRIADMTSIYAAESEAAKEALSWVANQAGVGAYLICTDSLSVVTALEKKTISSVWKDSMMSLYNRCVENRTVVTFFWVPSHVGIPGNERADREAKAALNCQVDRTVGIDFTELKTSIKTRIIWRWQAQWNSVRNNKLREIKNTVLPFEVTAETRRENVVLARLRIGHSMLTHQYLLERTSEPVCRNCNSKLTVKHIIADCPALEQERREVGLRPNVREALADQQERIETVIQFFKKIGQYSRI